SRQHRKGTYFSFSARGGPCCQHHQHRREHRPKSDHEKLLPLPAIRVHQRDFGGGPASSTAKCEAVSERPPTSTGSMVRIRLPPAESHANSRIATRGSATVRAQGTAERGMRMRSRGKPARVVG